jgi:hypothetical protein
MPNEMSDAPAENLSPRQAAELAVLVELEACWENLRTSPPRPDVEPTVGDLHAKQKAYEAFRAKLARYNKRYAPAHVPELLLNTPARLGLWCRDMRHLLLQVERDPEGYCPVHLLEKAHRLADRVAHNTHRTPVSRATAPATTRAAILDLAALERWCADLPAASSGGG